MAILSRRKQANKRGWEVINKQRAKSNKSKKQEDKEVTQEEHEKKLAMLKKIGLIKE